MVVCICKRVSQHAIAEVVDEGARTVDEVAASTGAGTSCGACLPEIEALVSGVATHAGGGCADCPSRRGMLACARRGAGDEGKPGDHRSLERAAHV